jgi:hypothetical protein
MKSIFNNDFVYFIILIPMQFVAIIPASILQLFLSPLPELIGIIVSTVAYLAIASLSASYLHSKLCSCEFQDSSIFIFDENTIKLDDLQPSN